MIPLHNKQIHSNIGLSKGKANLCRSNKLFKEAKCKHLGNLIKPVEKPNERQPSRNKNFQTNLLISQILIFKSYTFFDFYECVYCAVVS